MRRPPTFGHCRQPSAETSALPTCYRQSPEDLPLAAPSAALATAPSPRRRLSTQAPSRRETTRTFGHQNPGVIYGPGGQPADRNTEIFEIRRISDPRSSGATKHKSYENKHISLIQKISGASPQIL